MRASTAHRLLPLTLRRMPIIWGDGANQAIRDAIALDRHLAAQPDSPRTAAKQFVLSEHGRWAEATAAALHRLEVLHSIPT